MFFGKKKRKGRIGAGGKHGAAYPNPDSQELFLIEIDMMLKGSTFKRPQGTVRQCAVTVDGATRLVTSGDRVDRETYDALILAQAIQPIPGLSPKGSMPTSPQRPVALDPPGHDSHGNDPQE